MTETGEDAEPTTGRSVADAIDEAAEATGVTASAADPEDHAERLKTWIDRKAAEVEARRRTRSEQETRDRDP